MDIKLGVCEWILPGAGIFSIQLAKELGLDGLQLGFTKYDDGYPLFHKWFRGKYLELGEKYSIEYPSLALSIFNVYGLKNPKDSQKGKIVYDTIDKAVEAASHMKMSMIMLPSFFDGEIFNKYDLENTAAALRYACSIAEGEGITITSENLLTVEEQIQLIEMVDSKNFALFYDFENYTVFRQWDSMKVLKGLYKYFYPEMHVKDGIDNISSCMPIGKGHARFHETMDFLKNNRYKGWLHIENCYTKKNLRDLNPNDLISLVREDIKTIRSELDSRR